MAVIISRCGSSSLDGQLAAQRQPLLHAEAVLLVDDGQAQAGELAPLLDDRVRADDERRPRRWRPASSAFAARLALAAAAEPGDLDAQRLQPATSLAKCCSARISVGAISAHCQPASIATRRGQRGDHGLAGADVALQQAVHRHAGAARSATISSTTRRCAPVSANGSTASSFSCSAAATRGDLRRALQRAFARARQLRQLLREQLLELQALPRRMAAVFQRVQRDVGRRMVQVLDRLAQRRQAGAARPAAAACCETARAQAGGDALRR